MDNIPRNRLGMLSYFGFVSKKMPADAVGELFYENSIFPNSFPRLALQLDFSRKSKYFLKLCQAM
jgi:hypothetical protein